LRGLKMGNHQSSGDRDLRYEHAAALRLGNVESLIVGAAIGDVGGGEAFARANPVERFADSTEDPHRAQSGVGNGEIVFVIHGKAIGPAEAS
jgi:hypothetical protein